MVVEASSDFKILDEIREELPYDRYDYHFNNMCIMCVSSLAYC